MARNHHYMIASVPPALGATMLADALAFVEATNNAKTFVADPEVTLTNDPDDSARFRASVHFHVLKAERPNQVRRAIVDMFAAWKAAGAELDEANTDDEDVFAERPELKRRRQGEAVPKAVSIQLAEALVQIETARGELAENEVEAARLAVEIVEQKSRAEAAEMAVRSLRDQRDQTSAAHAEELSSYVRLVEAYRAARINPESSEAIAELEAAYEPFATPEG